MNIDPLSESFYDDSPFTYALNNPIYFIDPTGMSSEPNNGDETDCSKKGSCVQLQEVLITGKAKSSNPYDNPNVAARSRANSEAVNNTPATRNIDQGIKDFIGMLNPAIAAIYIADDLRNGKEVDNTEYIATIPAFKIFKVTKYGTIIEKSVPLVDDVTKAVGRVEATSLKEFKSLVKQLSKPGSKLTKEELQKFEKLTEQFGGKLRYDLNPVKGKNLQPHVQVEGLGTSVGSRHIWLDNGVK